MLSLRNAMRVCAVGLVLAALIVPSAAVAQGKGNGKSKTPPGHAKKQVTTSQAVIVSRDILVAHGYQIVRVERVEHMQVIYYRRGNNGRGRGLGPVEKMIIKPAGDIVLFESAPSKVLVDINVRLGL